MSDRTKLLPHWGDDQPADERAHLLGAWQAHRSCADCQHWMRNKWPEDDDDDSVSGCDHPDLLNFPGCVVAPADWTCDLFEPHHISTGGGG